MSDGDVFARIDVNPGHGIGLMSSGAQVLQQSDADKISQIAGTPLVALTLHGPMIGNGTPCLALVFADPVELGKLAGRISVAVDCLPPAGRARYVAAYDQARQHAHDQRAGGPE